MGRSSLPFIRPMLLSGLQFAVLTGLAAACASNRPLLIDVTTSIPAFAIPFCEAYADPVTAGVVSDPRLIEISGLASSRRHPGWLWLHNDSGDGPNLYAVSTTGATQGRVRLEHTVARDFEDIAVGPCPFATSGPASGAGCLFVADIGDNLKVWPELRIHVFEEPATASARLSASEFHTYLLRYPDASHNAEALLVDVRTGDLYVIAKTDEHAAVLYKATLPDSGGHVTNLEKIGPVASGGERGTFVSAAAAHPSGTGALLRTPKEILEFRWEEEETVSMLAFTSPQHVPAPRDERQPEAIDYAADGRGWYTVSEGLRPPLHYTGCKTED